MDAGAIAVLIPVIAVGGYFAWMISLSPLGKALAERLRHGPTPPGAAGTAEAPEELVEGAGAAAPGGGGTGGASRFYVAR